MATLNIKQFPDGLYRRLRARAKRERRSLPQQVIHMLEGATGPEPKQHSLMDLVGMGKEIWHGIDAAEHIRQERDSWD